MTTAIDLQVFHLLCAKLCHDLVGPVGAVANGVELVREFGVEDADEALDLIQESAARASDRLQFFRVAYGLAAGVASSVGEGKKLADAMFASHNVTIDWSGVAAPGDKIGERPVKLLFNILLLATEALPRGGTVTVRLGETRPLRLDITASGEGAKLSEELLAAAALTTEVPELTARTAQGHFAARYAQALGGALEIDPENPGGVAFGCTVELAE
jgi:histidine phosphotransferase ChpT